MLSRLTQRRKSSPATKNRPARRGSTYRPLVDLLEERVVPAFTESFDSVTAPALPAGWATQQLAADPNPWSTSSTTTGTSGSFTAAAFSAPNAATVGGPGVTTDTTLT